MCFNITLSDAADVVGECGKHFADIRQIIQLMYKDYHKSPQTMRNLKAVTEAMEEKGTRLTTLKVFGLAPYTTIKNNNDWFYLNIYYFKPGQ